jgi:hypothetical protein
MLYMWKIYRRIMLDVDIILKIIYFVCFPRGQATSVCTEDVEMYRQLQQDLGGKMLCDHLLFAVVLRARLPSSL